MMQQQQQQQKKKKTIRFSILSFSSGPKRVVCPVMLSSAHT